MNSNPPSKARTEFRRLQSRKRRIYLIALACSALIFLLSWTISKPDDAFVRFIYPIFALFLAGVFVILWQGSLPMRKLEIPVLGIIATMIFSRLAWLFYFAAPIDDHLLLIAGGHYWAVGVLIVTGFVVLGHKQGLLAGLIFLMLSVIIAATGIADQALREEVSREALIYLLRIQLFLALLLGLSSAATTMRDRMLAALTRAETLDQLANTDILTGLANRRMAEQSLMQQRSAAVRYGRQLSVISADLDHFKQINDTYGHAKGDEVLAEIAQIIIDTVRESDLVARWGGEELLIVAPETAVDQAGELAERCRMAIDKQPILGLKITLSLGVTGLRPGETIESLLARADALLYKAKAAGRNLVATEAGLLARGDAKPN